MATQDFACGFQSHQNYLRSLAMNLVRDRSSADDLVQDTALRAFRHWDKYKPGTNLRAWLSTIMRNAFINQFRKQKRQGTVVNLENHDYHLLASHTIHNQGEASMHLSEIETLLDSLDDEFRVPFVMMHEGFAYAEISETLNLPMGTVKSRIFWARKKLKAKMDAVQLVPRMAI